MRPLLTGNLLLRQEAIRRLCKEFKEDTGRDPQLLRDLAENHFSGDNYISHQMMDEFLGLLAESPSEESREGRALHGWAKAKRVASDDRIFRHRRVACSEVTPAPSPRSTVLREPDLNTQTFSPPTESSREHREPSLEDQARKLRRELLTFYCRDSAVPRTFLVSSDLPERRVLDGLLEKFSDDTPPFSPDTICILRECVKGHLYIQREERIKIISIFAQLVEVFENALNSRSRLQQKLNQTLLISPKGSREETTADPYTDYSATAAPQQSGG